VEQVARCHWGTKPKCDRHGLEVEHRMQACVCHLQGPLLLLFGIPPQWMKWL